MTNHPFRRFFGLFFLYIAIIAGLFILQFKNELTIIKNFGDLKLTLNQKADSAKDASSDVSYMNNFRLSYKGFILYSDATGLMQLTDGNGTKKTPVLQTITEKERELTLHFSEKLNLTFALSGLKEAERLTIKADFPRNNTALSIPYRPQKGFSVTDTKQNALVFTSAGSNANFALSGTPSNLEYVTFTPTAFVSSYAVHVPVKEFSFAAVLSLPLAQEDAYNNTIKQFRNQIVSLVTPVLNESPSEKAVVAYVAEKAWQNQFKDALQLVPESFKLDSKRTYLSAPYFDNLIALNKGLVAYHNNIDYKIKQMVEANDMSFYNIDRLSLYLQKYPNQETVQKALAIPASLIESKTSLSQMAEVINTYVALKNTNSAQIALLETAIDKYIQVLARDSSLDNSRLVLMNGKEAASLTDTARIGTALVRYGRLAGRAELTQAGYLYINSCLADSPITDIQLAADLYTILVPDNPYYPRLQILNRTGSKVVSAWSCAKNIDYSVDSEGTISLSINFPVNESHYVIINNIEPFNGIEIYALAYRSDPRFESYNSSGYVYNAETKTLFLKVRHKSNPELIKLSYAKREE